jgi:hypothetical protein
MFESPSKRLGAVAARDRMTTISSSKEEAADAMATTESMVVARNEIEAGCLRKNEGRNGSISEV